MSLSLPEPGLGLGHPGGRLVVLAWSAELDAAVDGDVLALDSDAGVVGGIVEGTAGRGVPPDPAVLTAGGSSSAARNVSEGGGERGGVGYRPGLPAFGVGRGLGLRPRSR